MSRVDIFSKFHKQIGLDKGNCRKAVPKKRVGWKFANRAGWKKCEFIWAYSFMKFAQNDHPTHLFGPTCLFGT